MTIEKVTKMLAEYKDVDVSEIKPESGLSDLGLDSLDMVEFIMTLEEEFKLTIEPDENIKTVKDLADFIDSLSK